MSAGLSGLLGKNRELSILSMPAFFFFFPVLKSTGSRFEGFVNDEFTTLIPVHDRIFSTSIDLTYTFKPFTVHHKMSWEGIPIPVREEEEEEEEEGGVWDEHVASRVRKTTMEVFAMDDSASVQVSVALHELRERERMKCMIPGDVVPNGTTGYRRKQGYSGCTVYIAESTLYTGGHEICGIG